MKKIGMSFVSLCLLLLCCGPLAAQILVLDGFEGYAPGALDKNFAGPNAAPNGSGNPWWGPSPPNGLVMGTQAGVNPHTGNQMLGGTTVPVESLAQNWYNLAYRVNGGANFSGNVALTFWFYDALGSGGAALKDFGALAYYSGNAPAPDYAGIGDLNGSASNYRLSLGASPNQTGAFDSTKYQARVPGSADGYSASGWFNTSITRSVGWHEAQIVLDGTMQAHFYIDGVLGLSHATYNALGYNVIELNTKFGTQTGYFDDVTFEVIPEPSALALLGCAVAGLLVSRRRNQ